VFVLEGECLCWMVSVFLFVSDDECLCFCWMVSVCVCVRW
jgi:hypothetical protein